MNWYKLSQEYQIPSGRDYFEIGHKTPLYTKYTKDKKEEVTENYLWWWEHGSLKVQTIDNEDEVDHFDLLGADTQYLYKGRVQINKNGEIKISLSIPLSKQHVRIPSIIIRLLYQRFGEKAQIYQYTSSDNIIKTALPIQEKSRSTTTYLDIGHEVDGSYMWAVDKNWKLYTIKVEDDMDNHDNWNLLKNIESVHGRVPAWGRYDGESGTCSLILSSEIKRGHPKTIELIKRKVEKMLDEEFGNPRIVEFDI